MIRGVFVLTDIALVESFLRLRTERVKALNPRLGLAFTFFVVRTDDPWPWPVAEGIGDANGCHFTLPPRLVVKKLQSGEWMDIRTGARTGVSTREPLVDLHFILGTYLS